MSTSSNSLPDDIFLFGASTAPYARGADWPMEEWDSDMATMRRLHFNTIRIFAPWDRIEQKEGVFDFSRQDHALDCAARHDLRVIVHFGGLFGSLCGCFPPPWLRESDRCHERMAHPESPARNNDLMKSFCPDDPVYRAAAFAFMERTIKHLAPRDNLLAWMTWNEPASPFCYCPHTQRKFRVWLKNKYAGNLDPLNAAWGGQFPVNYTAWDQVRAPAAPLDPNIWTDWTRFNQWRLHDTLRELHELTHRHDPRRRPTTANLVYHLAALEGDDASPRYGLDVGAAGQAMSIMGVSCYTEEHMHDVRPAWETAYKLSRLRSTSADPHRRTLVLETGAGPNKRTITEDRRIQTFWHLIAHNAKSIVLWNYRSRIVDLPLAARFNLMQWDGTPSARARYIADFSKNLQRHARLLNRVHPTREAAILTLEETQLRTDPYCGAWHPTTYRDTHDSRFGAYKLLWDNQIPADCITEQNLGELPRYRLLLLPMCEQVGPALAAQLRDYVVAGGTIIAESPLGLTDDAGRLQYAAPSFGLDEVFGCRTRDRQTRETATRIQFLNTAVSAGDKGETESTVHLFWSDYELCGGEPLARYAGSPSGTAAVVRHRYGKGVAIIAGTEVFRQYAQSPQPAMTRLLHDAVLASGARPTATLEDETDNIEVSRLTSEEHDATPPSHPRDIVYIITNHNDTPRRLRIHLRDTHVAPSPEVWRDLQSESDAFIDFSTDITLHPRQVLAVSRLVTAS